MSNIAVIAHRPEDYAHLRESVTAERVHAHVAGIVRGEVRRYDQPNLAR